MDNATQARISKLSQLHQHSIENRDLEAAKIYQEQLNELLGDEKEEVTSFHEYATTFATLTNPLLGVGVALFGREVCGAVEEALDDIPVLKNVLRFF